MPVVLPPAAAPRRPPAAAPVAAPSCVFGPGIAGPTQAASAVLETRTRARAGRASPPERKVARRIGFPPGREIAPKFRRAGAPLSSIAAGRDVGRAFPEGNALTPGV